MKICRQIQLNHPGIIIRYNELWNIVTEAEKKRMLAFFLRHSMKIPLVLSQIDLPKTKGIPE